ncbi:polymorphic toxin-type HINT domain-containing protein [Micromonospora sp. NBC_01405]|uniref:polymorphic toxin-type HINT domain-containing protein n=1 Tax=Micromonospora sp. NBC_01405 TaxID=2903589 RepID=UPI003244779E
MGALCATGVGCLLLAGAAAGALAAGTGFMVDVSRGDEDFSWSGLAGSMIEGGLDGALSAGLGRFGGAIGTKALGGAASRMPSLGSRMPGGSAVKAGGGSSARAAATKSGGSGGSLARASSRSSGGNSSAPGPARRQEAGCHSFAPSTRVLLADGSSRPISDLSIGDEVAATEPESGKTEAKRVTQLHINQDRDLTDVTVRDTKSGKKTVLKTTQNHPFWDATEQHWVNAGQLKAGHRLLVHDNKRLEGDGTGAGMGGGGPGSQVTVTAVHNFTGNQRMHDLTVADIHTYYVLAGDQLVLVHNCGDGDDDLIDLYHGTSSGGADNIRKNGVDTQYANPDKDFGQGFYTTTGRAQAEDWAARRYGKNGSVLHFRASRSALNGLNGLDFPGDGGAAYNQFVRGQRTGSAPMHGFDWVQGPMVANVGPFKRGKSPVLIGQQLSFHTGAAAALLRLVG